MPSTPEVDQFARRFVSAHIARDQLNIGHGLLDRLHGFDHADAVSVRGVDGDDVHLAPHQFLGTFEKIARGADSRAHAQPALLVLRRVGIFQLFLDVFNGDQALEIVLVVDHQQLLDAVPMQNFLGLFERGAHGNGDEVAPSSSLPRWACRSAIRSADPDW